MDLFESSLDNFFSNHDFSNLDNNLSAFLDKPKNIHSNGVSISSQLTAHSNFKSGEMSSSYSGQQSYQDQSSFLNLSGPNTSEIFIRPLDMITHYIPTPTPQLYQEPPRKQLDSIDIEQINSNIQTDTLESQLENFDANSNISFLNNSIMTPYDLHSLASLIDYNHTSPLQNLSNFVLLKHLINLFSLTQDDNCNPLARSDKELMIEFIGRSTQIHFKSLKQLLLASQELEAGSLPENKLFGDILFNFMQLELAPSPQSAPIIDNLDKDNTFISNNVQSNMTGFINTNTPPLDSHNPMTIKTNTAQLRTDETSAKLIDPFTNNHSGLNIKINDSVDPNLHSLRITPPEPTNGISNSNDELHLHGKCKPCAFFYNKKKGCKNGINCEFCHHEDHGLHTLKQWKKFQQKLLEQQSKISSEESSARLNNSLGYTNNSGSKILKI